MSIQINKLSPVTYRPPACLFPWLVYDKSLTQKLNSLVGTARLDVLNQAWEMPDSWDQTILSLNCEQVMHREILMWAFDSMCWYARSILPLSTYQANVTLFDRLKNESLGELIFNSHQIERVSLTHYAISPQSMEYAWLSDGMHENAPVLWVRLSEFRSSMTESKESCSFYLIEILLPGLLRYIS